jgi:large subunit ribosomal protein L24
MLFQAPDHIRHKIFGAPLSPQLKASQGIEALPTRTGDTVRIMRGDHKGFEGKITRVDIGKYKIYVEGLTREKVDGTTIFVPIHPSKVMITNLSLDDKWRKRILERKKEMGREAEGKPRKKITKARKKAAEKKAEKKPSEEEPKKKLKKPRIEKKEEEREKPTEAEKSKTRKIRGRRKKPEKTDGGS